MQNLPCAKHGWEVAQTVTIGVIVNLERFQVHPNGQFLKKVCLVLVRLPSMELSVPSAHLPRSATNIHEKCFDRSVCSVVARGYVGLRK